MLITSVINMMAGSTDRGIETKQHLTPYDNFCSPNLPCHIMAIVVQVPVALFVGGNFYLVRCFVQ